MDMTKKIWITVISITIMFSGISQENTSDLIQFSGVVVTHDSLKPVPYCNIIDKSTLKGTITDFYGYFSFVASKGDTLVFSNVGFKKSEFIIPDTLTTNKYSLIHMMQNDTIFLKTVVIYPWPSKEQFAEAFVNTEIPNDDYKRALANLERADMKERMDAIPMNAAMNFK